MSDDSFSMEHLEEAGQAIGAAVGFSKVASGLRESRRRKSMSRQDSITPEPDDDDLVIWVVNFQIIYFSNFFYMFLNPNYFFQFEF